MPGVRTGKSARVSSVGVIHFSVEKGPSGVEVIQQIVWVEELHEPIVQAAV
jgi:hypothetical protein